jgi:hypothetical protein
MGERLLKALYNVFVLWFSRMLTVNNGGVLINNMDTIELPG